MSLQHNVPFCESITTDIDNYICTMSLPVLLTLTQQMTVDGVRRPDLLVNPVFRLKIWLQEIPKQYALILRQQLRGRAHSTAQMLVHQLCQNAHEVCFVLVVNEAVMEDTHALMDPQAGQGLLAAAVLGAHHQHALQATPR